MKEPWFFGAMLPIYAAIPSFFSNFAMKLQLYET